MSGYRVPIEKPKPNIKKFIDTALGKIEPEEPPLVEYLIDNALMRPVTEKLLGRKWIDPPDLEEYMGGQMDFSKENIDVVNAFLDNQIASWYHMGYDFIRFESSLPLPAVSNVIPDTAKGNEHRSRAWQSETEGVITTWEEFEKYPWPKISERDFYIHNYICDKLPDGLGLITCHAGGVYEHVSRLMSYEKLCINLIDDPKLVEEVTNKIGQLIFDYNKYLLEFDKLSAIFQGEDFGFNTGTLISPEDIRKFFLPWHKKYSKQIHDIEKPYFLHSCGELSRIMDDLIDDVKIDGKHSFQDNILPITEAKKIWGDRICLMGGVDVDKLTRYSVDDLRKYVRKIIDICSPGGRFVIGAGNSITSYIPLENYLTMIDEALR